MTQRTAEIGSVSSGTMRYEDLIVAFADELEEIASEDYATFIAVEENARALRIARRATSRGASLAGASDKVRDLLTWALEDLFNALADHAPEGCYFGASEGDGSDYGFWPAEDEEDAETA